MPTRKETAQQIVARVRTVANARIRPMMGEYILYVDDKVAGQVNENELFIKVTAFGESFAPELEKKSPYPGARPAFVISESKLRNTSWLHSFIAGTVEQLPAPKRK